MTISRHEYEHSLAMSLAVLRKVRIMAIGGGWLTRPSAAALNEPVGGLEFLEHAISLIGGACRVLTLPTPTDSPCTEVPDLRDFLSSQGHVLLPGGERQGNWPSLFPLRESLRLANLVIMPSGNFIDLGTAGQRDTFVTLHSWITNGKGFYVGSSAGAAALFEAVMTADKPISKGGGVSHDYHLEQSHIRLLPGLVCPHYNETNPYTGLSRTTLFQKAVAQEPAGTRGIGLPTQCALLIEDGHVTLLSRDPDAQVQVIVSEGPDNEPTIHQHATGSRLTLQEFYAVSI